MAACAAVMVLYSAAFACLAHPCALPRLSSTTSDTKSQDPNGLRRTWRAGSMSPLTTNTRGGGISTAAAADHEEHGDADDARRLVGLRFSNPCGLSSSIGG